MRIAEPVAASVAASWKAQLSLGFAFQNGRSLLAKRKHDGPLVVQKPLYPEGDAVCHAIVVHPPGGIAGGDELALSVATARHASALLTTPGAGKWYRTSGPRARQALRFDVAGSLEWLPQETIVFDGARAELSTEVRLAAGARYIGWEIVCFGRRGSGERFARGSVALQTRISRGETLLWQELGRVDGGSRFMDSPVGLGGSTVCGTFVASGRAPNLAACRGIEQLAVTQLPEVLVARYLGDSSEEAKRAFIALWSLLRPALLGRPAHEPRIWRT